jgi:hypothetical protein
MYLKTSSRFVFGVTFVSTLLVTCQAIPRTVPPVGPAGSKADPFYAAIAGQWVGTLEYRDYSNDKRVTLPTTLTAQPGKDGASVELHFRYDEGKGRFVEGSGSIRIDPATETFVEEDLREKDRSEYAIEGLKEFFAKGMGELVLTGTGEDNDRKVDVRRTITINENSLTMLRETKLPGKPFQFRNRYSFKRKPAKAP